MKYPNWIEPTARKWRQRKRKEVREVLRAVGKLNLGSAFLPQPEVQEFWRLREAIYTLSNAMSQKNWGK